MSDRTNGGSQAGNDTICSCETAFAEDPVDGVLHLRMPMAHTLNKLRARLHGLALPFKEVGGGVSIEIQAAHVRDLTDALEDIFTSAEIAAVRTVFVPSGRSPSFEDAFGVMSLEQFIGRLNARRLVALMGEGGLRAVFQPIVEARAPNAVFAYEGLLRAADARGEILPAELFDIAHSANILAQLDLAARRTIIAAASEHGITQKIFINFMPSAIYDPQNCLRTTVALLDALRIGHDRVVFEVVESERVADVGHLRKILAYYREQGFGVAMDDLGAGYSSLTMLGELRPDYVKLDRDLVHNVGDDPYVAMIARKLIETARELGIVVIAEGVEREEDLAWLAGHGANYVQGYLFARPATPPPIRLRFTAAV